MLGNLQEINRILVAVNKLTLKNAGASERNVISILNSFCLDATSTNNQENIANCMRLGLLRRLRGRIFLTESGRKFFLMRTIEGQITNLTPNGEQKRYFLELLFSSKALFKDVDKILANFRLDFNMKRWFYDSKTPDENWSQEILDSLFQSDFLELDDDRMQVSVENNDYFSRVRHKIPRSEEFLMHLLDRQRITGDLAEELTVQYEKERLRKKGKEYLSLAVHRISKEDIYAGYDIISFDGDKSGLIHDRFIEVKGTSGDEPAFYWSKNEIEVAKMYGAKYWVYLWIKVKSPSQGILSRSICNPYEVLFKNALSKPEAVLYLVEV